MSRGRGRRHNQLPRDDLVAIAVVGERADHGGGPAFSGVWHTHIVLGSARGGQVDTIDTTRNDGVLLGVLQELLCQTTWGRFALTSRLRTRSGRAKNARSGLSSSTR